MSAVEEWEHGVYATYVTRKCRCDRCREASRQYMENRRRQIGGVHPSGLLAGRAASTALGLLRDRHRAEYEALYAEARVRLSREMGLTP